MPIRCMIIDDEPLALEVLENLLNQVEDAEIVASCTSAIKAFELLGHTPVDLLLLDIKMPGMNGLELVESLAHPPAVILVTAHREYAVEGFELNVLDYLMKPVALPRLLKALDKYRQSRLEPISPAPENQPAPVDFLDLRIDRRIHRIHLDEIRYLESLKDYVMVYTDSGKLLVRQTLSSLEEQLPADRFLRIHRSYIVSLERVRAWDSTEVELPKRQLPIGPTYQQEVVRHLNDYHTRPKS